MTSLRSLMRSRSSGLGGAPTMAAEAGLSLRWGLEEGGEAKGFLGTDPASGGGSNRSYFKWCCREGKERSVLFLPMPARVMEAPPPVAEGRWAPLLLLAAEEEEPMEEAEEIWKRNGNRGDCFSVHMKLWELLRD